MEHGTLLSDATLQHSAPHPHLRTSRSTVLPLPTSNWHSGAFTTGCRGQGVLPTLAPAPCLGEFCRPAEPTVCSL